MDLLGRVDGGFDEIGGGLLLRHLQGLDHCVVVVLVDHPLLRVDVPVARLLAVEGLVHQRDATDAQQLDGLVVDLALVGLDRAAVLHLDLVGLDEPAILLGGGDVGARDHRLEIRDAVLALLGQERHVERNVLRDRRQHLLHERQHFARRGRDLVELLGHLRELALLRGDLPGHLLVVGLEALRFGEHLAVVRNGFARLVVELLDALLRCDRGLLGLLLLADGGFDFLGLGGERDDGPARGAGAGGQHRATDEASVLHG